MKTMQELLTRQETITREMEGAKEEQYATLEREYNQNKREIDLMLQRAQAESQQPVQTFAQSIATQIREAFANKQAREVSLGALTGHTGANITASGAVAKTIYDVLPNLEKGLIWDKLGMKVMTGVRGDLVWPYATTNVEVEEVGEAVALTDKDIAFAKKTAVPGGLGLTIHVTNEAIDNAAFDLMGFVQTQISLALQRALNKKAFALASFTGFKGPFSGTTYATATHDLDLTYANLKAKKAEIAALGLDMSSFAYVCDNKTKAKLESTVKAAGQGGFIMENGKIDGDPVFVTEYINTKSDGTQETGKYYLEMGCWAYLAACQHGQVRLTIDPISSAKSNETLVTLNTSWSLTDLVPTTGAWKLFNLKDPS